MMIGHCSFLEYDRYCLIMPPLRRFTYPFYILIRYVSALLLLTGHVVSPQHHENNTSKPHNACAKKELSESIGHVE